MADQTQGFANQGPAEVLFLFDPLREFSFRHELTRHEGHTGTLGFQCIPESDSAEKKILLLSVDFYILGESVSRKFILEQAENQYKTQDFLKYKNILHLHMALIFLF